MRGGREIEDLMKKKKKRGRRCRILVMEVLTVHRAKARMRISLSCFSFLFFHHSFFLFFLLFSPLPFALLCSASYRHLDLSSFLSSTKMKRPHVSLDPEEELSPKKRKKRLFFSRGKCEKEEKSERVLESLDANEEH